MIAVDIEKRLITGSEILGSEDDQSRFMGDWWMLSVGSNTKIMIDGKKAQLGELKRVVEAAEPGAFLTVNAQWEFDHLKPSRSDQKGRLLDIEVWGRKFAGVVQATNLEKRTITFRDEVKNNITHEADKDAQFVVNGKKATFSDLKPNMHVFLRMSATKNKPDVAVTASGPKVEGIIKAVDADKNTIGINIPSIQMTAEGVRVANDARVVIDGREAKLSDLKPGMRVTLQMCAETDRSLVVGIATDTAAKEP
ncbi:MAG: hypothetical protein HY040_08165 [Planctomycetes bacterium]|nr:hypothetical protein [Planctomycetota bacterium]